MTNLPNSEQSGNLDNIAVTRAEFRTEIGILLEYVAQALGSVSGTYTNETVNPFAVELQGAPTIEIGAEPVTSDSSFRIANTQWVKKSGNYVGTSAPSNPEDGMLWIDKNSNPYTIRAYDGTEWDVVTGVPSGTRMLFQQTAAPTGWTKILDLSNHALRVTNGSVTTGGTTSFTNIFTARAVNGTVAAHTLTVSEMPVHNHGLQQSPHDHSITSNGHVHNVNGAREQGERVDDEPNQRTIAENSGLTTGAAYRQGGGAHYTINPRSITISSNNKGGGGSHTHGVSITDLNFDVRYVDVIIASKD
tara:strand:- start:630 stop:1541 length:912 start_codon:yes stop_codon:yes gene_type:complete